MSAPAELAATIVAREAPVAFLFEFVFASETKRVWTGFGKLMTLDAREWDGVGEVVSVEGLAQGLQTSAPAGRLVASGVSPQVIAAATSAGTEFVNRPLIIYVQPFLNRACYGLPVVLAHRVMKSMEISRNAETRTIAVTHEGPYTGRRRPPAGWYSDSDQQRRFPGDKFCERVFALLFKQERWPNYS